MRSNFIPHPTMRGEGRCRTCDFPFSKLIDAEVAQHAAVHKRYLALANSVGAPVPEATREEWRRTGLALQFLPDVPFKERLAGAERWLLAEHHEHLCRALLYGVKRLDLREYFTKCVEPSRLGNFQPDVAAELRVRYSEGFIG